MEAKAIAADINKKICIATAIAPETNTTVIIRNQSKAPIEVKGKANFMNLSIKKYNKSKNKNLSTITSSASSWRAFRCYNVATTAYNVKQTYAANGAAAAAGATTNLLMCSAINWSPC